MKTIDFDKTYLLRLLNGNTETMGLVLNEIFHNIPNCMKEISQSLETADLHGVVTYASRAKSALTMLRDAPLAKAFENIEVAAKKKNLIDAKKHFNFVTEITSKEINEKHILV